MVGLTQFFPMYNKRAGHVITLTDRIQECMIRSENGTLLDYQGQEMTALVNYIGWLSKPHKNQRPYVGRGLISLPVLKPDPTRGESIYRSQCAGCHGEYGQGIAPLFPALWSPSAFNDGAGMNGISKMAAFIQHNMPQNRMGILSPQEAYSRYRCTAMHVLSKATQVQDPEKNEHPADGELHRKAQAGRNDKPEQNDSGNHGQDVRGVAYTPPAADEGPRWQCVSGG